jgi:hypothetical protein
MSWRGDVVRCDQMSERVKQGKAKGHVVSCVVLCFVELCHVLCYVVIMHIK